MNRLFEFEHSQFVFNALRYQMHSSKHEDHGVKENELVDHWLSPSVARRVVLINLCLFPHVKLSSSFILSPDHRAASAADEFFASVFRIPKAGTKRNRDLMAQICNYEDAAAVKSVSATAETAAQFHHSSEIHDSHYSSQLFERDASGEVIPGPLTLAEKMWAALGENDLTFSQNANGALVSHRCLARSHFDTAAKRFFSDATALVKDNQINAIAHLQECNSNSFAFMGCGSGKSGIYNLLLLAQNLFGVSASRSVVISPHNSLLAQHSAQARIYFRGTSLRVATMLSRDIENFDPTESFDLLFISIHAWCDLKSNHLEILNNLDLHCIFVDEWHNVLGELFRHHNSWDALRNLAGFAKQIMCLSATSNDLLMRSIGSHIGLGDYRVIGSAEDYPLPEVDINLIKCTETEVLAKVIECIQKLIQRKGRRFKIHVMTVSKKDAVDLCSMLQAEEIDSLWMTSEMVQEGKEAIMQNWSSCPEQVLCTTFADGIDCHLTQDAVIVRGTYSAIKTMQFYGRVRPCSWGHGSAALHIFDTPFDPTNEEEDAANVNHIKVSGIVPPGPEAHQTAEKLYFGLFHHRSYKSVINGSDWLRKSLLKKCGIDSPDCNNCTRCIENNPAAKAAIEAREAQRKEMEDRAFVLGKLKELDERCEACRRPDCSGLECLPSPPPGVVRCYRCHGVNHYSTSCQLFNLSTHSKCCPYCLLLFDKEISKTGMEFHNAKGRCPLRDRVKRVLLSSVIGKGDSGASAKILVEPCMMNPRIWFEKMAFSFKLMSAMHNSVGAVPN